MQKTKFPGVYQRESESRKHGNRPDVCFYVTYRHYNKKVWEKVGWQSEGYSAKLAVQIRGGKTAKYKAWTGTTEREGGGTLL